MADRRVAYVLKGYPRRSELFIASEIWRLEQLGVPLRLFVLKPSDEAAAPPRRRSRRGRAASYLPATTSLSAEPLVPWLRANARPFLPGRRPRRPAAIRVRLARAAAAAAAQSVRARKGWRPRKIYVKELLQAVAVADRIDGPATSATSTPTSPTARRR